MMPSGATIALEQHSSVPANWQWTSYSEDVCDETIQHWIMGEFEIDGYIAACATWDKDEDFGDCRNHVVIVEHAPSGWQDNVFAFQLLRTQEGGVVCSQPAIDLGHLRMMHSIDSDSITSLKKYKGIRRRVTVCGRALRRWAVDENFQLSPELQNLHFGEYGFENDRKCPFVVIDEVKVEPIWQSLWAPHYMYHRRQFVVVALMCMMYLFLR